MSRMRDTVGPRVIEMAKTMKGSEIAKALGISRQLVNYYLSDKTRRRRGNMSRGRVEELRAAANARYTAKVLGEMLD